MDSTNLNNNSLKQEIIESIESTLNELNMTKEELIELIKKILEAQIEVSNEVGEQEKTQTVTSLDGIDISEIADDPRLLEKYFSEEELKELLIRFEFACSIQKLKEMRSKIELKELKKILEMEQMNELDMSGTAGDGEKLLSLSLQKQQQVSKFTDAESKKHSEHREKELAATGQATGSAMNKFFAEVKRAVEKTASKIQAKIGDISSQAGIQTQADINSQRNDPNAQNRPNNQNNQNNPNNQQRSANLVSRSNELSRQMRRLERQVQKQSPEVRRVRFNGRDVTATVPDRPRRQTRDALGNRIERPSKNKDVKLSDYLKEQNKSSPELQKEIESNLKTAKDLELEMRIQSKESEISNLKGQETNLKLVIDEKKVGNSSSAVKALAVTPDSLSMAAGQQGKPQSMSIEALAASQPITLETDAKGTNAKGMKEALKTATDLVKMDAITDKQKMLSDIGKSSEMKDVTNNMKKIQEDLKEAEKNKDLLKELKNQRFQDKFQGK